MSATNIDEMSFDELRLHWRRQIQRTDPINEDRARRAIENLTVAITGRAPRAVFVFSGPTAAQLAVRAIKVDLVEKGLEQLLLGLAVGDRRRFPDWSTEGRRRALLEESVVQSHRSSLCATAVLAFRRLSDREAVDPNSTVVQAEAAWHDLRKQSARQASDERLGLLRRNGRYPPRPSRRLPLQDPLPVSVLYGLYAMDSAARHPDAGSPPWVMPANLRRALGEAFEETGLFWLFPEVAFVVDRPAFLKLDGDGALHSDMGPAVRFRDGEELQAVHGVAVPDHIFERPESITIEDIDSQGNAEVRRVMIDRMGTQRYLELAGARKVHEDEAGVLWRRGSTTERYMPSRGRHLLSFTRAIAYVEVVNGTAEPDGTSKRYFLRVPPQMRTAREAVAWTYGLSEAEYVPVRRT